MEEKIYLTNLFYIYGELLTKKQQTYFKDYYISDLSLREIATNYNISFQAVKATIDSSKKLLIKYENVIKMYERNKNA
ncbi:MAG: hypothetical protein RSE41_02205 [Clostridia bacterium]